LAITGHRSRFHYPKITDIVLSAAGTASRPRRTTVAGGAVGDSRGSGGLQVRSSRLALAAAALVAAALPASPAAASPLASSTNVPDQPRAAAVASGPEGTARVVLLTGDVVTVTTLPGGQRTVTVEPAARDSGKPVTFSTVAQGDSYYVIPSDAAQLVASSAVDIDLFDVATLAREGYPSDSAPPVIVQYRGAPAESLLNRRAASLPGDRRVLDSIDAVAVDPTPRERAELWASLTEPTGPSRSAARLTGGVAKVWLDRSVHLALDVSVPQIGVPEVWAAGLDGAGVTVAVLDTGIDPNHPDLAGKVVATANFSEEASAVDGHGHGTHVASIIAGTGAASGGRYTGVAPRASLMVGKVLNDTGSGQLSWAIDGMEWAAHAGADVVNLSLGSDPTDGTDPASQALDALSEETGTLFVVAAGNDGADAAVGAPAAATAALTVGAVDDHDALADFSSRGPRRGDAAVKPNITAPGVDVVAARAAGTTMPGSTPVDDHYTSASGTSMATPHVAGVAALLAQAHPDWRYADLKGALVSTAVPGDYTVFQQGAGRVDAARAVKQRVYGPATADFGRIADPATTPVTQTLTYRNDSTAEVTLDVSVSGRGWDGRTVPASAITLSAARLTIPPGGTASADLTLDPTRLETGVYGGIVSVSTPDGSVTVRTPWSIYEASGTHAVHTQMLDRRGAPADPGLPVWVVKVDPGFVANDPFRTWVTMGATDESGRASFEVAPGVYDVYTQITTWQLHAKESTIAVASEVVVDADRSLTLDARRAKLRNPQVGERVDLLFGEIAATRNTPDGRQFGFGAWFEQSTDWKLYATATPTPKMGAADSYTKWIQASELVDVRTKGGRPVTLHPEYWPSMAGPALDGHRELPVVFAGAGSVADLRGASGKLALVRVPIPAAEPFPYSYYLGQIQAISDAAVAQGVAGLLLYADSPGALGHEVTAQPILQLGLSRDEGEALRAFVERQPGVRLVIDGRRSPERVYHVRLGGPGGFPNQTPVMDKHEFATIPARYYTDTAGQQGWFAWHAFSPTMETSGQLTTPIWGGTAWTELVASRGADLRWRRETMLEDTVLGAWDRFTPGERRPVEPWFESPVHYGGMDVAGPYPTTLNCTFCRQGDRFVSGQYRMDASEQHYQYAWFDPPQVRLFRDDQEIPRQGATWKWFQLPPGPGTYRLNMLYTQPGSAPDGLASRIETDWVFHSTPPTPGHLPQAYGCAFAASIGPCAFEPLIQLRYDLGLTLNNSAPAGERHTFVLQAAPLLGARDQTAVSDVDVSYSTDGGQTWTAATVRGGAKDRGEFAVTVRHPALTDTDGFVWLRVHAATRGGSSVNQTIQRAYRLD
jgi:subtilisin family serine protease